MARTTAFLLGVGLLLSTGCSGSARIEIASLNFRTVDPPRARFSVLKADRCFWWTDEQDQVWIALERTAQYPFLGRLGRFRFQMSLVLERPPAGQAREYSASKRELRAVVLLGPAELRYTSVSGAVALYRESGRGMRGSLRLLVSREASRWLGGWTRPTRHMLLGTFHAVYDQQRGRRIAAATESSGWDRPAAAGAPSSAPATGAARP